MQCVIIKDKFGKTIGAKTPNGVDSRLFTDIASLPFIEDNNKAATVLAATYNILPTLKTEVNGEPTIVFNTPKGTTQSYREALISGAQIVEYGYENKAGAFVPVGEVSTSLSEDNYHSVVNSAIANGVLAERKTFVNGRYVLVGAGEGVVPNVNANIVAQELRDKLGNVKVDNAGRIITPEKEVELPEVSERSELADSLINPLNYQPIGEDLLDSSSKGQMSIEVEDSIVSPIVEALKNSGLASEVSLMSNEEMNELRGVNSTDGGVVKGAVIGDKVILNKDNMTLDTPIHEFGHLWNSVAKIKNEELYKQGLNLIEKEGQEYIDYVKKTQPKLKGEALLEEALAQAIGDSGARILNEKRSSNLNKWFKDFFDWLSDQLGISQYSGDTLKNLTLDQFATAVAIEIIRGDQNNPLNPIVTEQTIGDKKSSITFNYLEEKRIPELVKSGKVKIHNDLGFMSGYHVFTHSPDDTLGGKIIFKREGKEDTIFEGLGGLYFTTIFDKIWAVKNNENGTSSIFKTKINQLRKVSKDGRVFFLLVKGSDVKGLSNPQGVEASLQTVANLIHSGILKPSIVKENIIKAVSEISKGKDSITLHKGVKTSDLIDDLMNYFHDDKKLSFERRGDVLKKLLQGIYADIKSDATTLSKVAAYMEVDNKLTKKEDFIDLFGKVSAEQRLKGLSTGDIYAAIEITHDVEEKEGKHKVFNRDLFMKDEKGNEVDFVLHLIEGNHNMLNNLVDVRGNDLSYYVNNPEVNARGNVKNPKVSFSSTLLSWNAGGVGSGIVRPQVKMSVDQDPNDLQLSNSSNGTGASTQEFFGNVVTGGDARYEPSKPYEYEEEFFGTEKSFQDNYDQKMGNFDQHIATSIPTFRETQIKKGAAIVRLFKKAPEVINNALKALKDTYQEITGIKSSPTFIPVDSKKFKELAEYHTSVSDDRNNEVMKRSYRKFLDETLQQFNYLLSKGYDLRPYLGKGEPYGVNSNLIREDLKNNNRLFYLMSRSATGEGNENESSENYMPFEETGIVIDGQPVLYNDAFRAVHDVFGHGMVNNSFSAQGELDAYQTHKTMYSKEAQKALFLETVMYNAYYQSNKKYAPRKIYDVPQEFMDFFDEGPVVYDLGGSEGSWVKTITEESNGNIKTINLDPSPEMQDSFNRNKPENSEMSLEAFYQGWDDVKTHQPKEKADIVHESMMFQFIDNDGERSDYIKEVKNKYLKDNGLFLTEEKFQMNSPSEYQANEELKVPHKDKYYTKEQQSLKADQVLVGMKKNQANYSQYLSELKEQFKYVQPYWFSGNFRGIVATDNKEMLDKFLREIGTTSNPAYTFSPTHKDVLRQSVAQNPFESPQKHPTKPGIKTVKIGNTTVHFREGAKKLTLEYIETERGTRKTGEATKALEAMKQYADQTHKEIHLFADPKDTVDNKALSEQKLIEFYRKNGFQSKYGHLENEMFYVPRRFSVEPVSTELSEITQRQTVEPNKDTKKSTPLYTNEDVYEVTDPKVYTDAMADAIDEMKKDPKGYKSAQLTPLTEEEATDILNTGGRIFMTKDNMSGGYVNVDGYMGGLFRNPKGKGGVSRVLQDARVAVGGRFFDSFAVNEERYLQNGFRPLIRQDFNPRYAPENWENTTLKTRPDNVFFVYDPNYKATLGEGTRNNDYNEAYKQSKNFTPTPSIPTAAFNSIIDNMMKDPPEGFNMTCGI